MVPLPYAVNDFHVSESEAEAAFATDLLINGRIIYHLQSNSWLSTVTTHNQTKPAIGVGIKGNKLLVLTQDLASSQNSIAYVNINGNQIVPQVYASNLYHSLTVSPDFQKLLTVSETSFVKLFSKAPLQ